MEQIAELINKYGVTGITICLLIFMILWFMKLTYNLITTFDKRLDSIDKSLEQLNSSQTLIVELIKAFVVPHSKQSEADF